mgnify:CR=1 FL=1
MQESFTLDDKEFFERFGNLFNIYKKRYHSKIDYAKVYPKGEAFKHNEEYWNGWNAALDWCHRIIDGDKSAD